LTTRRRVVKLVLTDEGRAMAAKVPQVLSSVMNAHMAGFSHDESRKLLDMLRRLLANGDAMRAPEGPAPTAGETRPAA
jgi:DNA-binding MarR family transcriptional regulator